MTTKAQDAVIDAMADDGTVFVKPLQMGHQTYSTVLACVLATPTGWRKGPWMLIAEDGATITLRAEPNEQFDALDTILASTEETT